MKRLCRALAPVSLISTAVGPAAGNAAVSVDPLRFFVGTTQTIGTTKILMQRPVATQSIGHGQLNADGSLVLVQRVQDQGQPPYLRRWEIRQTGPGRYSGTMSQAAGPVLIEQVGNRYRFTFRMKGDLSVEQWLTPLPGGASASSSMVVRKFGLQVATSTAVVKKLP
jgi:hypothetical protein